ncbi:MAG: formylglycine-generating enzyme family protein [Candidatus Electronema sp. V4]|uniref:formylglycine-generating enzyme family protein n=1 Tax=Candidatus Electronema sp. V4 TaxID=3454756 RepID=UPI00405567BF
MHRSATAPASFPPSWASSWGEDVCGIWLTISLRGIRQLFRWIKPGRFLMGSPEAESEGYFLPGKETRHEVRLSKGFWLADTAVTQELWQAVMQANPSGFSRPQHPVERVSWDMAQQFLRRLNALIPGLNARLPTEAEWECACRAGSGGPFSFGEAITPEQVNYNPSEEIGEKLCRRRTVPVKSLPANAWGLHEMHGNIWEWCQDWWQEDLGGEAVLDPQGAAAGVLRVVKGGSWVCGAGYVRAASRDRCCPDYSGGSTGLRLAV